MYIYIRFHFVFCILVDTVLSRNCQGQIDSDTIDGNLDFVHSLTAVFLRHKCQLSFCVRQNYY